MTINLSDAYADLKVCSNCMHPCHCNNAEDKSSSAFRLQGRCCELVGIGMTDKNDICGCKKCSCDIKKYPGMSYAI